MKVSSLSQSLSMRSNINRVQTELLTKSDQISSGKISTDYAGLGTRARSSISFRSQEMTLESYKFNISTAKLNMQFMDPSLERIGELTNGVRDTILRERDGSEPDIHVVQTQAKDRLEEFNRLLNIQYDDKYLFAGTATATKPMADPATALGNVETEMSGYNSANAMTKYDNVGTYMNTNVGDYYNGSTSGPNASVRIDDGIDIDYGIRADDPAFQKILKGLYVIAETDYDPAEKDAYWDIMERATNDLKAGFDELRSIQASLGDKQSQMENALSRHNDSLLVVQQQIGEVEDVDSAEAIQQFQLLQTQLNASYSIVSSLSQLSLTNYIR